MITTRGGTGSTYDGGGYDTTLAHLNAKQLGRVCEADKNPSLLSDTLKMLAASCPPKEILRLLFTGRTKTEPHRKGTNLTKMLGWGLLDGARISPELSTVKHYAKTHGPAYLGELVADKLIADNLADPEHMVDLQLPELWEAMRGNDWSKIDAYNFILKPMQETGPCGNHMGAVVRITEKSRVWKDALNNTRLPPLLAVILQGVGLPYKGPDSLPEQLKRMNNFIMFQGGAGARRRDMLLDAGAALMNGLLKEAGANVNRVRDVGNLEAPELTSLLDPTGDSHGPRRAWAETERRAKNANEMQKEFNMMEPMAESVDSEGIKTFLYAGDGRHDDKRRRTGEEGFPATSRGERRSRSRSRDSRASGGGGGIGGGGGGARSGGGRSGGGSGGGGCCCCCTVTCW